MPKTEPVAKGLASIDLELGACLTGPTKRLIADLHEVARLCNIARNGMARYWQRWHEDNQDYVPQQRTARGKPKLNARGEPVIENAWMPQHLSKDMYDHGSALASMLYVSIVKCCLYAEVADNLGAPMPYNHWGKAKHRWKAILTGEGQLPTWNEIKIPIPNGTGAICYSEAITDTVGEVFHVSRMSRDISSGVDARVKELGKSSCVVRFPLFSSKSGRAQSDAICRLHIGNMSDGHRALLMRIAKRECGWEMRDSFLIFKRGKWFLQLVYYQPRKNLGLDKSRHATLMLDGPKSERPFRIEHGECAWQVGHSRALKTEYVRLTIRRKTLQYRYRDNGGGHGKRRFFAKMKPYERATQDMQSRFCWNAVKEIIKFCTRNNCGTIVYREPSMPLRGLTWFARNGIHFNWTKFLSDLKHKCNLYDIDLVDDNGMGWPEYRERWNDGKQKGGGNGHNSSGGNDLHTVSAVDAARKPQGVTPTAVTTLQLEHGTGKPGHQGAPLANGKVRRRGQKS